MAEKRCPACKKFKELQHFHNDGGFCVTRPSFKICADCRARARSYFKKHSREYLPKGKYNKRESEFRTPVINIKQEEHCDVESDIMFDPKMWFIMFILRMYCYLWGIVICLSLSFKLWRRRGNLKTGHSEF